MEASSSTEDNSQQLTAKQKEREQVKREYRMLNLEISEIDEDNLDIERLNGLVLQSDALYGRVEEVQEAVQDAHTVYNLSRLSRAKTEEICVNAMVFKYKDFAEKLVKKIQGVIQEDGQVKITHKKLVSLGSEVKSSFNRVPVHIFLNGAFGYRRNVKEKKPKKQPEKKQKATQKSQLVSTQSVVVEKVEKTGSQTDRMVVYTLEHLVHQFRKGEKKPIQYYRFVMDPKCFGKSVENMFHVSFLVKEGKVKIVMEHGVPYLIPTKLRKPGEQVVREDEQKNQVVLNFNMRKWAKIVEEYKIKECLIPPIHKVPKAVAGPSTSKA